jgi:thiamine-phosphate pyrophosphorylase
MFLPRLYVILDSACFDSADRLLGGAEELVAGGVTLLQYRNKSGSAKPTLDEARQLKRRVGTRVKLIMNDRADLCLAADFDGVHVGQDDLSPEAVRRVIGNELWLGVSTHNPEQLRKARSLTRKPLVAIGGITRANCRSVVDAGADAVAVISDVLREPRKSAEEFLRILR